MRDILQSCYPRRRVAHKQLARTSLRHDVVFLGIHTSEGQQCWSCSFSVIFEFLHPGDCFSKILKLFWSVMGPTVPFYSFTVPRSYKAIKLRNPLGFSYIRNMFKDQLFKTSGMQFDRWLFGTKKFMGFSRKRPHVYKYGYQC